MKRSPAPTSVRRINARRIAAAFCLATCGGFLFGTIRERIVSVRERAAGSAAPPPKTGDPRPLWDARFDPTPAARAMGAADFEMALEFQAVGLRKAAGMPAPAFPARF